MKKLFGLLALVLGMVSCQTEPEGLDVIVGGEQEVTINVAIPEAETRANSAEGAFVNVVDSNDYTIRYIFAVYYGETCNRQVKYSDNKSVAFDVRLVPDRDYQFVVWADVVEQNGKVDGVYANEDGLHYDTSDLKAITLKNWDAMDETRDAFTGTLLVEDFNGSQGITVNLTRPFAKLRVVTTDFDELAKFGITATTATVSYTTSHRVAFNAYSGVAADATSDNVSHEYTIVDYDDNADEDTIFVDYFFAGANDVVKFNLAVYEDAGKTKLIKANSFNTDIPVKRNHLTTISGNVLTDGNNIKVEVENGGAFVDTPINVVEYSGYINETITLVSGSYIFRDLNINTTNDNAVIIDENANVTIDIVGKVNLKAAKEAIKVSEGATLTINGREQTTRTQTQTQYSELVADGGIGGDVDATININNIAKLTAKGNGDHAFGIGGTHANVNIENTTIDYVSGGHVQPLFVYDEKYGKSEPEGGAAIGGAQVNISNSTIEEAWGGSKAAAIGNSYHQSTEVTITNSTLVNIFGGNASAAIGGSRYASGISADNKQITKIKITNSTITKAVGGQYGAGIGSGYDTHCAANETNSENEIVILNSTITAQGGKYAAGIGTGFHAASLTGSIDAESTVNATSGEPFYKNTYTFAQHVGYGVIDPAREGKDLIVTFEVNRVTIATPDTYATYNIVNNIEEFQAALNGVVAGNNLIIFADNISGEATIYQIENANVIVDGNAKLYDGTIYVEGNNRNNGAETLKITNINFETTYNKSEDKTFIVGLTEGESYPHKITIEKCSFKNTVANNFKYASMNFSSFYLLTVKNCTATNMHSLLQAQSCDNTVVVENCKVIAGKNGVAFGNTKNASITGTTIAAIGYGVRGDGTDAREVELTVSGCTIDAYIPVVVRKLNATDVKKYTLNITADNTLNNEGAYQIALGSNEYEDGKEPIKPVSEYKVNAQKEYVIFPAEPVAKIGNTEYTSIDEAIAAWTNNTTLTLLSDVTLNDVITLKSTEHHTLDLGTYTMTAASGKNAIEITCNGRSGASYAITVNADATNPGGITATGKACIYYKKGDSTKDRPIIRIYNGVFTGSYSINSISNGNTNCPQVWIYGGTFNSNVNLTKNMLRVWGGTFHGWINCTGDSSAYREISGGRFKSWQFMTADALGKFWVGTAKDTYDVGVYVDKEGYLVVGGPVLEKNDENDAKFEVWTETYKWSSSYLKYSSAATNGLYFEDKALAESKKWL